MNEQEWLSSVDPQAMLGWLNPDGEVSGRSHVAVSDRKLRLFACACCRSVWHLLTDERSRRAVEVAEQHADGQATDAELAAAWAAAWAAAGDAAGDPFRAAARAATWYSASRAAAWAAAWDTAWAAAWDAARDAAKDVAWAAGEDTAWKMQSNVLRCIFGNPSRPMLVPQGTWIWTNPQGVVDEHGCNPAPWLPKHWLTWHDATVPRLAQAIYDNRTFDRLPILADALEEAGCDNEDILAHLRSLDPHARGCWTLDVILGKE